MAYPKNNASPERIAVGPVVQISDGAVQTSGVSIKVKPQGAAASAGGGTTSYEEGIVGYLPTQAETNYTSFQVIAYKTGCIPAAVTVVTSANGTPGVYNANVTDWGGTGATLQKSTMGNFPQVDVEAFDDVEPEVAFQNAIFDEAAADHVSAGTFGKLLNDTLADTNELQTDWVNGGRLDLILDARASQTSVDDLPTNSELAAALPADVYYADIDLSIDEANTQDEYTIRWFKNGVRVTSGITSPTITVTNRAGTVLINAQTMTQIGSTGAYKYDATSGERMTAGEGAIVSVAATIDAGTRTYDRVLSRDSTA